MFPQFAKATTSWEGHLSGAIAGTLCALSLIHICDLFISLPGLTLALGEQDEFADVMKTAEKAIREFINGEPSSYKIYEMDSLFGCFHHVFKFILLA